MSLNGFIVRAGGGYLFPLGKLVPSFGFGGGQTQITQFAGCSDADNQALAEAALAAAPPYAAEVVDEVAFTAALAADRVAEAALDDRALSKQEQAVVEEHRAVTDNGPVYRASTANEPAFDGALAADEGVGTADLGAERVGEAVLSNERVDEADADKEKC